MGIYYTPADSSWNHTIQIDHTSPAPKPSILQQGNAGRGPIQNGAKASTDDTVQKSPRNKQYQERRV